MSNKIFYILLFLFIFSFQCFAVQVNTKSKRRRRTRTFLDESFKITKKFIRTSTNSSANFSMKCKPLGGTDFVSSAGYFTSKSTNYFSMIAEGECPYKIVITNNSVCTTFTKTGETDRRPLAKDERFFDDFLGIASFDDQNNFIINFLIEGNLYLVSAILKPEVCAKFSLDFVGNARKAVQRQIWIDPNKEKIVKTQMITLEGKETICYF